MLPTRNALNVIPGLDGLRAFSILCVLVSHLLWVPSFPFKMIARFFNPADLGVRIFFVISGFLITTLLLQEKERFGTISLKRFYFRRTLRIFPAYYFFLASVFALAAFGIVALERSDYLYTLTYTFNFKGRQPTWWVGHTWSLAVEEQFYLMWPIIVARCSARTTRRVALACFIAGPIGRALLFLTPDTFSSRWYIAFPFVADPIAGGALLALAWQSAQGRKRLAAFARTGWIWLAPLGVLLFQGLNNHPRAFPHPVIVTSLGESLANVGIAFILVRAVSDIEGPLARLLNSRAVVSVGVMSYSLYLWQMLFLNPTSTSALMRFPLDLLWVVIIACASFFLIERPINNYRRNLAPIG